MSYRVESAVSGRAVCQATECKTAKTKIDKDELRFGSWITFEDRGSWSWRHWGCVSGKQLQNARNNVVDPEKPGVYRWDFLDGYEGDEKGSLSRHPDLQDKVRRVFTQGFIDPEDWNGDPEMNKLGETGLHTAASKKRMREAQKQRANEIKELEEKAATLAAEREALLQKGSSTSRLSEEIGEIKTEIERKSEEKKVIGIKRVKDEAEDDNVKQPARKKRATKAKKEELEKEVAKPAKKAKGKKAVKQEDEEMDELGSEKEKPTPKKSRGKKVVKEEEAENVKAEDDSDSAPIISAPKKRAASGKKAVKKEDEDVSGDEDKETLKKTPAKRGRKPAVKQEQFEAVPAKKTAPKRGRKAAVKEQPSSEEEAIPEAIESSALANGESPDELAATEESQNSAIANTGPIATGKNNSQSTQAHAEAENAGPKSKKGGRSKKAAPPAEKPTRASRGRKASKA